MQRGQRRRQRVGRAGAEHGAGVEAELGDERGVGVPGGLAAPGERSSGQHVDEPVERALDDHQAAGAAQDDGLGRRDAAHAHGRRT